MQSSAIRELLKLTERPEMISFAGGLPAPEVFPVSQFQEASRRVLVEHASQALQYSTTEGYRPLREMIARHTARYGIVVDPDNILITSGSQQALDLIGKVFINPGDHLLVEKPTYVGALQAWNAYQGEYVTVALDIPARRPLPLGHLTGDRRRDAGPARGHRRESGLCARFRFLCGWIGPQHLPTQLLERHA
jgi:2-aminoadipate transaminase